MKTIVFSDNHIYALNHLRKGVLKYFVEKGYNVVTIAPETKNLDDNSIKGVKFFPIKLNRTSIGISGFVKYFITLLKLYKKIKPIIIFHYTIKPILFGSIAAKLLNIPSIALFAGLNERFKRKSLISDIGRRFLKFSLQFPNNVVFMNDEDMNFLISQNIVCKEKCILFQGGEGLDTDYYKPGNIKHKNGHPIFIMISRILYTKGYNEYVEAAKKVKEIHPDAEFILCGEFYKEHPSSVPEEIVQKDHNAEIIKYEGRINNVHKKLQSCDCFILPSYYNEGMNRSLMEALSTGVPIITTDNQGCREMVINEITGYIIEKQNVDSLVVAILKFCALTVLEKERMRTEARQLAINRFSEKIVIEHYQNIIDEITRK